MKHLFERFKNIHYQKITWDQLDTLTPEQIKDICNIDNLFRRKPDNLKNYIDRKKEEKKKIIFYLMYDGKELLGCTIGHLKKTSELYIKENPNANFFHLSETFINPKYQGQGVGTVLMERVIADQRAKHKSEFIYMTAFPETQKINQKVTGNKAIVFPIKDKVKTREVLRSFKHSNFKYDLVTSSTKIEPSKNQYIAIKKNSNYKKREIRSRAK